MSQTFAAPPEFEPPYTLELGGQVVYKSLPTYARAVSLAKGYIEDGTTRKVELFDHRRRRVVSHTRGLNES